MVPDETTCNSVFPPLRRYDAVVPVKAAHEPYRQLAQSHPENTREDEADTPAGTGKARERKTVTSLLPGNLRHLGAPCRAARRRRGHGHCAHLLRNYFSNLSKARLLSPFWIS